MRYIFLVLIGLFACPSETTCAKTPTPKIKPYKRPLSLDIDQKHLASPDAKAWLPPSLRPPATKTPNGTTSPDALTFKKSWDPNDQWDAATGPRRHRDKPWQPSRETMAGAAIRATPKTPSPSLDIGVGFSTRVETQDLKTSRRRKR
jgi:hypothetical protein